MKKKKTPKISSNEPVDWMKESEESIFKKKRAKKLAKYLTKQISKKNQLEVMQH